MTYKSNSRGKSTGKRGNYRKGSSGSKTTAKKKTYTGLKIWTDGSALKNPKGAMGWAWHDENGREDAGGAVVGTNQIGELTALYKALLAHPQGALHIISDSQYAINVAEKWSKGWKKNGWKTAMDEPVKNLPLVKAIRRLLDAREDPVCYEWVKGHNGNAGNERVDQLAHGYAMQRARGVGEDRMPIEGIKCLEYNDVVDADRMRREEVGERHQRYHSGLKLKEGETKKAWKPRNTDYTNHR